MRGGRYLEPTLGRSEILDSNHLHRRVRVTEGEFKMQLILSVVNDPTSCYMVNLNSFMVYFVATSSGSILELRILWEYSDNPRFCEIKIVNRNVNQEL